MISPLSLWWWLFSCWYSRTSCAVRSRVSPNTTRLDWPLNTAPLTCSSLLHFVSGPSWWLPLPGRTGRHGTTRRCQQHHRRWMAAPLVRCRKSVSSSCRYRTTHNPLLLPLLATYWTTSELIGQRWLYAQPIAQGQAVERLDHEGRRQRIALLDCSCEGANVHHGMPASMAAPPFQSMQFAPHPPHEQRCWNTWFRPTSPMLSCRLQFATLPETIQGKRGSSRRTPSRP